MEIPIAVLIVAGIVIIGYFFSKVASRLIIKFLRSQRIVFKIDRKETVQTFIEKAILLFSVFVAIAYLGMQTPQELIVPMVNLLPQIILVVLFFIMGSVIISFLMWFIEKFLYYIKTEEYFSRESKAIIFPVMVTIIRMVLYLTLLNIIFSIIEVQVVQTILGFILYPIIILFFFLVAIGSINPIRDFFARMYLLNMLQFRPGSLIKLNGDEYTIKAINSLYTELEGAKQSLLIIPNRLLSSKIIEFKKPVKDLQSLKQLQEIYVPQIKSHCGPATMAMVLSIFHYKFDQKELGRAMNTIKRTDPGQKAAGTHPKEMIEAAKKVTDGNVLGAWIPYPKIFDLKKEVIVWLKQGGLVIIDMQRKYLFPKAKYAHYSLVVGVRGDEFLIVDSGSKTGGVYFSDYRDVLIGMDTYSELIKGKRGYIVVAPKGTEAYQRIKSNKIFYHPSMYDKVTKNLNMYLSKISNPTSIKETMPEFMRNFLKDFQPENQISRVWKP